jgi:hypothetical protein
MVRELLLRAFSRRVVFLVLFSFSSCWSFEGIYNLHFYSGPCNKAFIILDSDGVGCRKPQNSSSSCVSEYFLLVFSSVNIQVKLNSPAFPVAHPFITRQHPLSLPFSVLRKFWFSLDIHPFPYDYMLWEMLSNSYSQSGSWLL